MGSSGQTCKSMLIWKVVTDNPNQPARMRRPLMPSVLSFLQCSGALRRGFGVWRAQRPPHSKGRVSWHSRGPPFGSKRANSPVHGRLRLAGFGFDRKPHSVSGNCVWHSGEPSARLFRPFLCCRVPARPYAWHHGWVMFEVPIRLWFDYNVGPLCHASASLQLTCPRFQYQCLC